MGGSDPPILFADNSIDEGIWGSLGAQDPGSEVREAGIIGARWILIILEENWGSDSPIFLR